MKRIFSSPDSAEVGMWASRLEAAGIECEIRNESQVIPGLPFQPELWVLNDTDSEDAAKLIGTDSATSANESGVNSEGPLAFPDVASMDTIIQALYETISGPAGERNWDRFRSLFYPGARLLRTVLTAEGQVEMSAMDVEGFIDFADPFLRQHDFYERELLQKSDRFGHIAQVFSTFDSSTDPDGNDSLGRGINSIQLWFDGQRWWITSMLWDDERPENEIPADYLP